MNNGMSATTQLIWMKAIAQIPARTANARMLFRSHRYLCGFVMEECEEQGGGEIKRNTGNPQCADGPQAWTRREQLRREDGGQDSHEDALHAPARQIGAEADAFAHSCNQGIEIENDEPADPKSEKQKRKNDYRLPPVQLRKQKIRGEKIAD